MLNFDIRRFFLGSAPIPESRLELVRREQFNSYVELIPAATFGMLLLSATIAVLNWGSDYWPVYFAFCYALIVSCFFKVRLWVTKQRIASFATTEDWRMRFRQIAIQAALSGAVFGAMIGLIYFDSGRASLIMMGGILVGLLCTGGFILAVIPNASIAFVSSLSLSFLSSFVLSGEYSLLWHAPLLTALGIVVQRMVLWYQQNFVQQVLACQELQESNEVIGLLLHDFETHASDWLWEVNSENRLVRVSKRFAEAMHRPREVLEGAYFIDLFEEESAERLEELMSNGRSFRNFISQVRIGGETHWWSISARPHFENDVLKGYRGVCSDVTQERTAEAKVAYMAHFDALTGVANRAFFSSELEKAIDQLQNAGEPFALHSIDLDDFKGVNDVHGHQAGDELLKTVARRLQECVKDTDLIGRQGGDEFVVLQRALEGEDDAVFMADCLCDALLDPVQLRNHRLLATGSVGSVIAPRDGRDIETLFKHADLALYAAKKDGRGCARFFAPHMDEEARRRSQIEQELRQALRSNELELYFQPLIDVRTMDVKGYESLLRWNRPNGEIVLPSEFIEIAENTGLIIPLGEWVIRTAIAEASTWPEHVTVAINLSPAQMTNPSLISTVMSALAASALDPGRVEFEITESVLLEESDLNLKTLHTLRGLGVKIALDDFGTGFSSLNYLRAFPFDKIKIDKCFVQEMENREDCRAIIKAVMSLARSLKMRTTAEGVENENQMRMLREEGCSEFQGYLFSRPIPASNLPKYGEQRAEIARGGGELVTDLRRDEPDVSRRIAG